MARSYDARNETELFFQGDDKDTWRVSSYGDQLPNQAETVAGGTTIQAEFKSLPDLDYLQVLGKFDSWPGSALQLFANSMRICRFWGFLRFASDVFHSNLI